MMLLRSGAGADGGKFRKDHGVGIGMRAGIARDGRAGSLHFHAGRHLGHHQDDVGRDWNRIGDGNGLSEGREAGSGDAQLIVIERHVGDREAPSASDWTVCS